MSDKKSFSVLENPDALQELDVINHFFKLESIESLILVPFIYQKLMNKNNPDVEDIVSWLQVELSEVLVIHRIIQKLCFKRILKKVMDEFDSCGRYMITEKVYKSILGNEPLQEKEVSGEKNLENFLESFGNLNRMFQTGDCKSSMFHEELRYLLDEYSEIPGVGFIRDKGLENEELVILMSVMHKVIMFSEEEVNVDRIIKNLGLPLHQKMNINRSLMNGENPLISKNLLRFGDTPWKSTTEMTLSTEILNYMMGIEYKEKNRIQLKRGLLIEPSGNQPVLFYNTEEEKQISIIEKVLSVEGYASLRAELEKKKMNTGLSVLLYGAPGTGKTSSVYSLAARTGRKVYKVEVESINSMYVGESEKNLVEIFREYEKLVNSEEQHPILLLNECDSLLKKRMSGGNSAVTEMMNTMTTILLEKLENFTGIIFGTMNNINYDHSFSRRWLFKLELKKPEIRTRIRILHDQFPELTEPVLERVAEKYELTGGQIANIRKKFTINSLVNPAIILDECIEELCDGEFTLDMIRNHPIGFSVQQ